MPFEHGPIAQVVVKRHAGVVDEDVERFDALDRRLDLRRVGHVQGQGRDARIRMGQGPAGAGVHPLRASPQCFLDQRLTDAAIGPGHQTALSAINIPVPPIDDVLVGHRRTGNRKTDTLGQDTSDKRRPR